jgi:hypothetical protein
MPSDWDVNLAGQPGTAAAPGYLSTTVSSVTVSTGSKTVTTQSGLAYTVGARTRISSNATPTNFVEGLVTAYSGTSLTINADLTGGSGSFSDGNINVAGQQGTAGLPGAAGGITRHAIVSFKASGTWTKNANLAGILVECWGGGGCGANAIASPGGSGGGYARKWLAASALAATVTVTVGAGGISTSGAGDGGSTTFAHSTPIVGGGGKAASASASVSSGGDEMFEGQFGNGGISGATVGSGGAAYMMGVAGVAGNTNSFGPANSGGGGASGSGGGSGGAGGSGYCRVTEYYLV